MFLNQIDRIRFDRIRLALVSLVPADPRVDIKQQALALMFIVFFLGARLWCGVLSYFVFVLIAWS